MEFNFINPGHITTEFNAVVIMREECEINMFGEVSYLPLGPPPAPSPVSSSHKNSHHETTVLRNDWIPHQVINYRNASVINVLLHPYLMAVLIICSWSCVL